MDFSAGLINLYQCAAFGFRSHGILENLAQLDLRWEHFKLQCNVTSSLNPNSFSILYHSHVSALLQSLKQVTTYKLSSFGITDIFLYLNRFQSWITLLIGFWQFRKKSSKSNKYLNSNIILKYRIKKSQKSSKYYGIKIVNKLSRNIVKISNNLNWRLLKKIVKILIS